MTQTTLTKILAQAREAEALSLTSGLLGWDTETMMPPQGNAARGEQSAAQAAAIHRLRAAPELGAWLAQVDPGTLDPAAARNHALIAKDHARATRLPADLVAALARCKSRAFDAWRAAREANSYAPFAPVLAELIALKIEEADALRDGDQTPYDVLVQQFEPDMTAEQIATLFDALRPGLVKLRARIADAARPAPTVARDLPTEPLMALARTLAARFGYAFEAGRLDLSVHPFSSGKGRDVRITTRISTGDPFDTLYSTLHETGHAVYEQGIDPEAAFTPVGRHCSMAVHESQSRLFENQLGRSRAFCTWLFGAIQDSLGDIGLADAEALYRAVNHVSTGFIRTEADEVHYNLHVMLRFDLERQILAGKIAAADLEEAWNTRFAQDFGQPVPDATQGILQDIHWSQGYFGYFPTYALGNLYAAQVFAAMAADLPTLEGDLSQGDLSAAIAWLRPRIHHHGALYPAPELMRNATGAALSSDAFEAYLRDKYGALYGL